MQNSNNLYNKAYAFAIKVVTLYEGLCSHRKEYVLSRQILRCGTAIGANIAEANGGISTADFSAKLSIAYKECLETQYWLSLLRDTKFIQDSVFFALYNDADELGKILFTVLKKTRINKAASRD